MYSDRSQPGRGPYMGKTRGFREGGKIKVAVVTGGHNYDVPGFRDMFETLPEIDYFIQELDNWAIDDGDVWDQYDVHLFYNMHQSGIFSTRPPSAQNDANEKILSCIEKLGETGQGVLLPHCSGRVSITFLRKKGEKVNHTRTDRRECLPRIWPTCPRSCQH